MSNPSNPHSLHEVFGERELAARVAQLGEQITRDYAGRELTLLVVLGGAFIFAADLCRRIRLDCRIDFVRLASYGASAESAGEIRLVQPPMHPVAGRDILVVEDIVDTGLTLSWLTDWLRGQGVASTRLCALIDKKERRKTPLVTDYTGFTLDQGFLVGYGLDFAERYRNLPAIHTVRNAD